MKKNKPYGAAAALLAGALLGGLMTAPGAHAVDFRVKGVWIAMLEYGDGGSFVRKDREGKNVQGWGRWGEDRFEAKNRVRLQLDAAVSDALSGSVLLPDKNAVLRLFIVPVDVPEINASQRTARLLFTDDKLHGPSCPNLRAHPFLVPFLCERLLINEIFPHPLLIAPRDDPLRIFQADGAQKNPFPNKPRFPA